MATYTTIQAKQAPLQNVGIFAWVKENLLSSPLNVALTVLGFSLIYWIIPPTLNYLIFDATWSGTKSEIVNDGARWIFIHEKFSQYMQGFYPQEETYRNILSIFVAISFVGILFYVKNVKIKIIAGLLFPIVIFILIYGGFGLPIVTTDKWGGLMLTLIVATITIIISFPIGIVLALGRRSKMPIIKWFCITFIEFIRGVPLITILFMASVILPLFFSEGLEFDKLLRAIIGFTLFQSAYVAEAIRGGLQAIPKGQYEAAEASGLTYWQSMILVILPQAIKISIPNLVGISIALLKDTTLLLIIGVFDILAMVNLTVNDSAWIGFEFEGYIFVALVYWIICFSLSKYATSIEKKLDKSH